MRFFRFPFFLFVLFGTVSGHALTLSEALVQAASNPELLESRLNVDQVAALCEDAGKRGPDAVSLEAENFGGNLRGFSQSDITLSLSRPIIDRKKSRALERVASLAIDGAIIDAGTLKREILTRVQANFHLVIGLQNLYRNAQDISRINQEMLEAAKSRVDAGASPEAELVKAQLDVDRAGVEKLSLEGQLDEAMIELFRSMGRRPDPETEAVGTLTSEIEIPGVEELRGKMFEIHPQLLSATQSLKENQARQILLSTENRPTFSWVVGARNFRETGDHAFVLAIEAELPNRKANQGARKAARTEMEKISLATEKTRLEILTTLDGHVKRFQRTRETVSRLQKLISPNAQKALELALTGYRLGKTDQIVVLEARKAYAEVTKQTLTALLEMYQALDAIENLTGQCLVGEKH